jgi:hypothetical protein
MRAYIHVYTNASLYTSLGLQALCHVCTPARACFNMQCTHDCFSSAMHQHYSVCKTAAAHSRQACYLVGVQDILLKSRTKTYDIAVSGNGKLKGLDFGYIHVVILQKMPSHAWFAYHAFTYVCM